MAAALSEIQSFTVPLASILPSAPAVAEMELPVESIPQSSSKIDYELNPFCHAGCIQTKDIMVEAEALARNSDLNWDSPFCIKLAARIEIIFHRNIKKYSEHALETDAGLVGVSAVALSSIIMPVLCVVPLLMLGPHEHRGLKIQKLVMWRKAIYKHLMLISDNLNLETPTRLIDIFNEKYGRKNVRRIIHVDKNRIMKGAAGETELYIYENRRLEAGVLGEKKFLC